MKYCLCSRKDWISLLLGIVSVLSWGVAEVPQIITNFKEKSSEGLAIGFLMTWIIGDILNVLGCLLEPATLPTQYYTAVLYLVTTLALSSQSMYYGHFRHRGTSKRQGHEIESADKKREFSHDGSKKQLAKVDNVANDESTVPMLSKFTQSLPILAADDNTSPERVYYTSARSLSRSPTPIVNFFHSQRTTTPICNQGGVQEPLLHGHSSRHSAHASETKTMLCVVFTVTIFLCTYNLKLERNSYLHSKHEGIVMQVGRKLLQVRGSFLEGHEGMESNGIGTFLGWGMAAIYVGGRLPQIFLNIRRGNVQGLNPLMFMFALLGNSTYVASILVSSMEWSKLQPNLPWLVESSGCMLLDTFILIQFIYFRCRKSRDIDGKHGGLDL